MTNREYSFAPSPSKRDSPQEDILLRKATLLDSLEESSDEEDSEEEEEENFSPVSLDFNGLG
jgi:hypothetical protein